MPTATIARLYYRALRASHAPILIVAGIAVALTSGTAEAQQASPTTLKYMSLTDLANVEITSVSKAAEPLRQAPAAIFVITHDEIIRSGATSIPEVLRLAPNLQITQLTSSSYAAGARGFGGKPEVQNFSNKLLILIDGRSVYSPLFSGVYFDGQDTLLDDIDRIEVISGPGATLWGANAVNGVVNIITRSAYLTDGTLVRVGVGNAERNVSTRYGTKLGDSTAFRIYGKAFQRSALDVPNAVNAGDDWYKAQSGLRMDWSRGADSFTAQGDLYRAIEHQAMSGDQLIIGGNALARWQRLGDRAETEVQAYVDQTQRGAPIDGVGFVQHTYDLDMRQTTAIAPSQRLVWGAGVRLTRYRLRNSPTLLFEPSTRLLRLANVYVQDTWSLPGSVKLTFGMKLEDNPYSGREIQPDFRASWELNDSAMIWAAASRAIRSPTPFDDDVVEKVGTSVFLQGNPQFVPERMVAYELGYRAQPAAILSLSISAFFNHYDNLRTVEPAWGSVFLPLRWDNMMRGDTYGMEAWANWQVTGWWRLSPGIRTLHKRLQFKPGASELVGLGQAANDPNSAAVLRSSMDLGSRISIDTTLRAVGALPDPALPGYTELNLRFGWHLSRDFEVSLTGSNLLRDQHLEYPVPAGERIGRSFFVEALWKR